MFVLSVIYAAPFMNCVLHTLASTCSFMLHQNKTEVSPRQLQLSIIWQCVRQVDGQVTLPDITAKCNKNEAFSLVKCIQRYA